jgi:hypothetical protein
VSAYIPKRHERGQWITPRNIERAACFACCCMFLVIAWIAFDPHSFRAFVLGLLS